MLRFEQITTNTMVSLILLQCNFFGNHWGNRCEAIDQVKKIEIKEEKLTTSFIREQQYHVFAMAST